MTFGTDLESACNLVLGQTKQIVRGTIAGVNRRIIQRTPVGDPNLWLFKNSNGQYVDYLSAKGYPAGYVGGSLRSSWQASIGAPNITPPLAAARNQTLVISEANAVAFVVELGQTYYLTSALPYSNRVEMGWSSQQPNGMVRRSVAEAQAAADQVNNS